MPNHTKPGNHVQLRGHVVRVHIAEAVHVWVQFGDKHVKDIITRQSAETLRLRPGDEVIVVIGSAGVTIAKALRPAPLGLRSESAAKGKEEDEMQRSKLINRVTIKKPLRTYSGDIVPAGAEITVTDDRETAPYNVRGRVILNPQGERRLVAEEDLDYALGAH